MLLERIKRWINKWTAIARGYSECRGIFCIKDQTGALLDGVQVSYRIGRGDWVVCTESRSQDSVPYNYYQPDSIFYKIGEPVEWRFEKPGYKAAIISRYTACLDFNQTKDSVMLYSECTFGETSDGVTEAYPEGVRRGLIAENMNC